MSMLSRARIVGVMAAVSLAPVGVAQATPSTQIWIPSTDVQKFATAHLNYDVYARPGKATALMLGPTVGFLPTEIIQGEVGFDLTFVGNSALDDYPLYLHAKLATPEDSLFGWSPAIAVGIYNAGIKSGLTNQNVGYALLARTLPIVGRLSAGYFFGNPDVLVNEDGEDANHGLLLSWDRSMKELSEKLWLAIDYQGSASGLGALSGGLSWAFSDNVGVIVGYDHYLNEAVAGKDTFTVQLDVNI